MKRTTKLPTTKFTAENGTENCQEKNLLQRTAAKKKKQATTKCLAVDKTANNKERSGSGLYVTKFVIGVYPKTWNEAQKPFLGV